jgi:hypothetical protein
MKVVIELNEKYKSRLQEFAAAVKATITIEEEEGMLNFGTNCLET